MRLIPHLVDELEKCMENRRKAMITGASRGIGEAVARKLAAEGFDLVITCQNNMDRLQDLACDLSSQYNISCMAYKCDIADSKGVRELFECVDHIDVLINNAGISHVGLFQDMTADEWNRVLAVNLGGVFNASSEAVKLMLREHKGKIINISSMWGQSGASMEVAYSASKGGVDAFTKALAKELAPSHISVNALSFGVIDTDMNRCFSDEERENLAEEIPFGRFATVEEAAEAVWALINMPEYVTGQIVRMDGGYI